MRFQFRDVTMRPCWRREPSAQTRKIDSMRVGCIAALLVAALTAAGCQTPGPVPLVEQRDATGFVILVPTDWKVLKTDDGRTTRYVPPGASPETASEFIAVLVRKLPGPLDDPAVRRLVFSSLPIHGVSGFLQDPRSTPDARWDRFDVTGSSGGVEWASVGAVVSGAATTYLVVCAKPFDKWRDGQKQCDEVVRTFQPGKLD